MAEQSGGEQPKPPRWARYQVAFGALYLNLGVGLFVVQGVDSALWGVDLDFGLLPLILTTVGLNVVFGPVIAEIVAGIVGRSKGA